jgi:hypothetical protein
MSDAKEYERLVEKRMILIGEQIVRVKKAVLVASTTDLHMPIRTMNGQHNF